MSTVPTKFLIPKITLVCLCSFFSTPVCGQFTYNLDQTIPVRNDSGQDDLTLAWAGGLNAAQYNALDLNNDGAEDLVIFDRMASKVLTFLREGVNFVYDPAYESSFPDEILNWVLLRDYNCDGRKDLFTGDNLGIKVYTNTTPPGELPTWSQRFFYAGSGKSSVLLTKGFTGKINVQLQFDDLPSISDLDGDGDLDVMNMRYAANGTVEFHKNFGMERYGRCDSLDFERVTQTWGSFRECSCGVFAFNGQDCPTGGRTKHAGGKSLLAIDLNGDSEEELLFSEATCSQLFKLANSGTVANPIVETSSTFPPRDPAAIVAYPTPYYEDIDGDGKKDLMICTNVFTRDYLNSDFKNSNWFFKNIGTTSTPEFSLITKSFLQSEMIDVGDNAVPAFFDVDADGDYDLFISNFGQPNLTSPVFYYENTGSSETPEFSLKDENYLNLVSLNDFNRKIQFADINHDNTFDLVFTSTLYADGVTRLNFIPNKSSTSLDFSGQQIQQIDLQLQRNENVYVFDVDQDGVTDLLVGRSDGSLELWTQSAGNLAFALSEGAFAGLDASVLRQYIAAAIGDLDSDGTLDLLYGDQNGILNIIPDYRHQTTIAVADLIRNPIRETYEGKNLGGRTWPSIVNLFGSTRPAIVTGNTLGGLCVLKHDEGESLPEEAVIDVSPNPINQTQTLTIRIDRPALLEIFTSLGRKIAPTTVLQPFTSFERSINGLASGLYVLRFTTGKKSFTKKLIIER